MASGALAIPSSYHKPTPSVRKSKLDATQVRSEDELLKFFLHGSYDVQRGAATSHPPSSPTATATNETQEKAVCIPDKHELSSTVVHEESKSKSRCMFEETYMINISVQQPDAVPSSKQIDVRIEKTPSDLPMPTEKIDADEISSIFDEEEDDDHDEIDSVIFNELSPADSQAPATKLTLADMINKTLTTIPGTKVDQLKNITTNHKWFMNKPEEIRTAKPVEEMPPLKAHKKPSHPTLTANKTEDERLFEYLDYLETKEESNSPLKTSTAIPVGRLLFFFFFSSDRVLFLDERPFEISASTIDSHCRSGTAVPFVDGERLEGWIDSKEDLRTETAHRWTT